MQNLLNFLLLNLFTKLFLFYFILSQNFRRLMIQNFIKSIICGCRIHSWNRSSRLNYDMLCFLNAVSSFNSVTLYFFNSWSFLTCTLTSNFINDCLIIWLNENLILIETAKKWILITFVVTSLQIKEMTFFHPSQSFGFSPSPDCLIFRFFLKNFIFRIDVILCKSFITNDIFIMLRNVTFCLFESFGLSVI